MWPWGHLAFAYLLYVGYARVREGRRPTEATALLVAVGSQVPDLIDKPFAWTVPVLPTGRSLAHSLLVVGPVLAAAYVLARRRDRASRGTDPAAAERRRATTPLVVAFAVGTVAHSVGDALYPLVGLEFEHTRFLLWPALSLTRYDDGGFVAHFTRMEVTPTFAFELLLVALALGVWYADGCPGLATVRAWSVRLLRGVTGAGS